MRHARMNSEILLQRAYYERTATQYNDMHGTGDHDLACEIMAGFCHHHGVGSILDIGSGTGRALLRLGQRLPDCDIRGIEPVAALREVAYANGVQKEQLREGDATRIAHADGSFDLVCELGMLHHVPQPRVVLAEMLRVAKKGIFLSDSNRFGQGAKLARLAKLLLHRAGLWPIVNRLKTRGLGYHYDEVDGVYYSYSVFDDLDFIRAYCAEVTVFNIGGDGARSITGAPHVGLFALKKAK